MRRLASLLSSVVLLCALAFSPAQLVVAQPSAAGPQAPAVTYPLPDGVRFLHTASVSTISGSSTRLAHPASINVPSSLVFATHTYRRAGGVGQINDRAVGAYYILSALAGGLDPAGVAGDWGLRHEDATAFNTDLAYNIMIAPASDRAFLHTATVTNTLSNATAIDSGWLDGRLDRIPFILHNLTPYGTPTGPAITPTLGIFWDTSLEKWSIFTEDASDLPTGTTFSVMVGLPGANVFTHTATVSNLDFNQTFIDHPLANGNPNAVILVTQSWNPDGAGYGVYNNHHVGVYYSPSLRRWSIYNEDGVDMPVGASFSVLIDEPKIYLPLSLR